MHSALMGARNFELIASRPSSLQLPAKCPRNSQSRKTREQVAAVCYRITDSGIEFLLVRTRKGHWTFPKGGVEPGLTRAQTAALEAFEEAGVHGRIEEDSFAKYTLHKRNPQMSSRRLQVRTQAHLCEVLRLSPPQESNRNPSWCSPAKAKRRLQAERRSESGIELACVIDRAVIRIERLHANSEPSAEPLQRVYFDAPQAALRLLSGSARFLEYISREKGIPPLKFTTRRQGKILRLGPGPQPNP